MAALAAVSERQREFELLRARLSAKPPALPVEGLIPTAIPELDLLLGGGFPAGTVVTLEGKTGCWSLAAGLVARTTRRSLVAILDDGSLYPPALAKPGHRLSACWSFPFERQSRSPARPTSFCVRVFAGWCSCRPLCCGMWSGRG